MKSFIRWAGSKRQILNVLRSYWPGDSTKYIEPFCGSASLFFDILPQRAILGDINGELIKSFRAIQQDVNSVIENISNINKGKRAYYHIRSIDPTILSEKEMAARFIYLNYYCFNGLYRTNIKGHFNVPFGRSRGKTTIDKNLLMEASDALQKAKLVQCDFEKTLEFAEERDFVYLDPPYLVKSRRIFSDYVPGSFNDKDLCRLGSGLKRLDKKGVYFLLSYAESKEARELVASWKYHRIIVRRNIAGFTGARRHAYELLATNIDIKNFH